MQVYRPGTAKYEITKQVLQEDRSDRSRQSRNVMEHFHTSNGTPAKTGDEIPAPPETQKPRNSGALESILAGNQAAKGFSFEQFMLTQAVPGGFNGPR